MSFNDKLASKDWLPENEAAKEFGISNVDLYRLAAGDWVETHRFGDEICWSRRDLERLAEEAASA